MRLFIKHILRSIKKSVLQPLIILLTLTVAVATFITAFKISDAVIADTEYKKGRTDSTNDITVRLSKSDDLRLIFKDEAERIIANDGEVLGEFVLTALKNDGQKRELVNLTATELSRSDSFYSFKFTEYDGISERDIDKSAIISTKTAERLGIGLGDNLSVELLGATFNFKVCAIALDEGVFSESDVVINIGAVLGALAEANPLISAFADTIIPFTTLRIKINDPDRIDEFVEKLKADEHFENNLIIKESENVGSQDFAGMLSLITVLVCTVIILIIAGIVITTSLDLISKERVREMGLFMLSGADSRSLSRILYLECLFYSLFAAVLGTFLSLPAISVVNDIFDFLSGDLVFEPTDALIAFICSPVAVLAVAKISTLRQSNLTVSERLCDTPENSKSWRKSKLSLSLLVVSILVFAISFLLPIKFRYILGFLSTSVFIWFIFVFTPLFTSWLSTLLAHMYERLKYPPGSLLLATKNAAASYPLLHTARIVTLLFTLISTAFFCLNTLTGEIDRLERLVDADYIVANADERTEEILKNTEGIEKCFRFAASKKLVTEEGTGFLAVSLSDDSLSSLDPGIAPERIPKEKEAVITSGIASLCKKSVGDSITLSYEGIPYSFTVIEIITTGSNLVYLDARTVGEKNDLLCIKANFSEDSKEYSELCELIELRGSYVEDAELLTAPLLSTITPYCDMTYYVTYIAALCTLIGIINVLYSAYASRRRERKLYYTIGMTKSKIRLVGLFELVTVLLSTAVLVPIFTFTAVLMLDTSLISFGVDLVPLA